MLLREQTLLRQWGNNGKAPAGAGTAAAVGENRKRSYWSRHCCSSGENTGSAHGGAVTTAVVRKIQVALLLEQALLGQWGNEGKAPAGAGTAGAVGKRERAPAGAATTAVVGK